MLLRRSKKAVLGQSALINLWLNWKMARSISFYDDTHFDYRQYWQGREYENQADKIAFHRFLKFIPLGGNLLDAGGGFGRLAKDYSSHFRECLIIDASEKHLALAKKLCKQYANLKLKKGLLENLPLNDNSFSVVVCIRTFHHLDNPVKAIQEIYRVLKPGGYFILEFANKARFKNMLKACLRLNLNFLTNHQPTSLNHHNKVPFFSYHPNQIKTLLLSNHFSIIKTLSVSNLREPLLKKIIPLKVLIGLEKIFSWFSSCCPVFQYFGPSIFVLAQKKAVFVEA